MWIETDPEVEILELLKSIQSVETSKNILNPYLQKYDKIDKPPE